MVVVTAPVPNPAWVDVDMRHITLGRRDNDWWTAFHNRTPNRVLHSGRVRVPCNNRDAATHTVELLAAFGIPRAALRVGGVQ